MSTVVEVKEAKITQESIHAANQVLNLVAQSKQLKNDTALAKFVNTTPPVISKVRAGKVALSDGMLIRIFEKTDIPMKQLLAMRKGKDYE
jgi:hypothetical protein